MAESPRGTRAFSGIAAAAVALGVAGLLGALFGPRSDARTAVGSAAIDLTPGPIKEWAITTFGVADKLVLSILVLVVIAALAATTAMWETRRTPLGSIAIAAAGLVGCAAVLSRAGATALDVVPTVVGAVCGIATLRFLISGRSGRLAAAAATPTDPGRRRSLITLGFLAAGVFSGVAGAVITRLTTSVSGDRDAYRPPPAATPAPPIPPGVAPEGVALPPFITPNADFYRIDTALSVPQLSRADWQLRIHGMVDHETVYRFEDLAALPAIEKAVTLTCVSNPVGGDLISTAVWTGYRTRDLLARAGVHPDADMLLSMSVDGFTAGTPVAAVTDDRDSLLAIGMNGQPLPTEHGYPARLVVPGLYGYVSATKWVVDLELTRFDRAQAYWTRHGWSARGPIKTQSRIDVPRNGQIVDRGPVSFGGIAWAQRRGIRAVEVRIDDGLWQAAQLGTGYSGDTWRLWRFGWDATQPGSHTVTVRATDNTGAVQTEQQADPVPDGATGWHTVSFTVR